MVDQLERIIAEDNGCPYICSVHGLTLIHKCLDYGKNLEYSFHYLGCPVPDCQYAKADKWGPKNFKMAQA